LTAARRAWAADLLHFWFHELRPEDWFRPNPQIDGMLRRRYARWLDALRTRPAREFVIDPVTTLAAVVLLDQVPRNIHRGTPLAFAADSLALDIAHTAIARGWDRSLHRSGRQFLGLPLMHSEAIADQEASLSYFATLRMPEAFAFARAHHRMIARFGRFPHRNEVLGRRSTPAERRAIEAGFQW
jgi:uncharacterized protein (DUF924 family)